SEQIDPDFRPRYRLDREDDSKNGGGRPKRRTARGGGRPGRPPPARRRPPAARRPAPQPGPGGGGRRPPAPPPPPARGARPRPPLAQALGAEGPEPHEDHALHRASDLREHAPELAVVALDHADLERRDLAPRALHLDGHRARAAVREPHALAHLVDRVVGEA